MKLLAWAGIALLFLVAFVLGFLARERFYYEIYERGRSLAQRKRAERWLAIALPFVLVMIVAKLRLQEPATSSTFWSVLFWSATTCAFACAVCASAVTTISRALAAFAAVLAGTGFLIWAVLAPIVRSSSIFLASEPIRVISALLGALMLYAALRLARPPNKRLKLTGASQ